MANLFDALRSLTGQKKQVNTLPPEVLNKIQNAKYGVLAGNKQAQQSFIAGQKAPTFNAFQEIPSAVKTAVPQVGLATGLAASRMGIGLGQGISGLVDLATLGTGTSRVTKVLNNAATNVDSTAVNNNVNPAYKVMQAALTPASFYGPGGIVKAASAIPKVAAAQKLVTGLDKAAPIVAKASDSLSKGNALQRILGIGLQGATPLNTLNAASGTATDLGRDASQGQQISPLHALLTGGLNVATPIVTPAAGQAAIEGGKVVVPATRSAVKSGSQSAAKALNVKPYRSISDAEVLAGQKFQAIRAGQGNPADVTAADKANFDSFLKKTGLTYGNANDIVKVLKARNDYENEKIYRSGNRAR